MRESFNQVYFQFLNDVQQEAFDITENFQPEGISQAEYSVLEYLYFFKGHSVSDVKGDLYMSDYKARKVIKSLLEKNFIESSRSGRKLIYHITRPGKLKLDACFFQVMKNVQQRYAHLDDETIKNLVECMNYISKVMYEK